mgnify:CR=1 FL=1
MAPLILGASMQSALSAEDLKPLFKRSELSVEVDGVRHLFMIEIADTPTARGQGLMGRRHMDEDAGMLFDFGSPRRLSMWMKNTYISLDMLFIDQSGLIIGIASNTTPLSLRIISHPRPALAVLELKAGTVKRLKITVGDRVLHGLFQP